MLFKDVVDELHGLIIVQFLCVFLVNCSNVEIAKKLRVGQLALFGDGVQVHVQRGVVVRGLKHVLDLFYSILALLHALI